MAKLFTLTVPDFLWINLQIMKRPSQYNFARLEQGVFYQYGAGGHSQDVIGQAAKLLTRFADTKPFSDGNQACALAGCLGFLKLNGYSPVLDPAEAVAWANAQWQNPAAARDAIAELVSGHEPVVQAIRPDSKTIMKKILTRYTDALSELRDAEQPLAIV